MQLEVEVLALLTRDIAAVDLAPKERCRTLYLPNCPATLAGQFLRCRVRINPQALPFPIFNEPSLIEDHSICG
ncbi:MAG: hypothetical protein M5U01_22205 [Ardenticatenaceae bacterium]|nr:hypothetical protein [Ardenticatenaceae bacterium]